MQASRARDFGQGPHLRLLHYYFRISLKVLDALIVALVISLDDYTFNIEPIAFFHEVEAHFLPQGSIVG